MKKTGIGRLLQIAGEGRVLLILSGILSTISAVGMLIPYLAVYFILAELLTKGVDPGLVDSRLMVHWGFWALGGAVIGLVFSYAGGMASHVAAFRILYGLRVRLTEHIARLHLGYLTRTSTGAVKKTVEQNVEKIENFIAHQIPDLINVAATVVIMFAAMFYLSPVMAGVSIVCIIAGFAMQASMMSGSRGKALIREYHDALERINASAIQYVRGMPAVKIFGQTVHSFRRFHNDLTEYRDLATGWTDQFQTGFVLFKTILASFLAFVLPVGILLLSGKPESMALALAVLFFIIMGPGTVAPIYKLMYLSSNLSNINEGVARVDAILDQPAIKEPENPLTPQSHTVELIDVTFSYDAPGSRERSEALSGVTFTAQQGKVTALVGPSGSGKSTRRLADSQILGCGSGHDPDRRRRRPGFINRQAHGYGGFCLSGCLPVLRHRV